MQNAAMRQTLTDSWVSRLWEREPESDIREFGVPRQYYCRFVLTRVI